MNENTVVFDIEGLVTYPNFAERIIRPVREQGFGIKFWTFASSDRGERLLRENDLGEYAGVDSMISYNKWSDIRQSYTATRDRRIINLDKESLAKAVKRLGLATDEESIERFVEKLKMYERVRQWPSCKFPPILGDGNYLLVESDCTKVDRETGELLRDDNLPNADKRQALDGGYSLIIVPDYPYAWENDWTSTPIDTVVDRLSDKIQSWQGEHIVEDLRVEFGMLGEWERRSQEIRDYKGNRERFY